MCQKSRMNSGFFVVPEVTSIENSLHFLSEFALLGSLRRFCAHWRRRIRERFETLLQKAVPRLLCISLSIGSGSRILGGSEYTGQHPSQRLVKRPAS